MPPPRCTASVLGDGSKPMQLEPIYIGQDELVHDIVSCGPVDIVKPPQGGKVIFIGVRATNLDPCGAKIDAALRDPTNQGILGNEMRSFMLTPIPGRPGWGESSPENPAGGDLASAGLDLAGTSTGFANFANMTMCPNVNARDVQRLDGLLEIFVTDRVGRKGSVSLHVIPRCAQSEPAARAECECTCEAGYTMQKCADVSSWDAGSDAGSCPATDDAATRHDSA